MKPLLSNMDQETKVLNTSCRTYTRDQLTNVGPKTTRQPKNLEDESQFDLFSITWKGTVSDMFFRPAKYVSTNFGDLIYEKCDSL